MNISMMKKAWRKYWLAPLSFFLATPAMCAITFDQNGRWETSYNYSSECSQRGNLGNATCDSVADDGIDWWWGANMLGGHSTQAVSSANNPVGSGGLGARFWNGDGSNQQTGVIRITFPGPQKELWIRWYQRYEKGYSWQDGSPYYDKTLYINTGEQGISALPQHNGAVDDGLGGGFVITAQGGDPWYPAVSVPRITWSDVFGRPSTGEWHAFEIHIKMDSGSSDGIGQMWIDGNLVIDSEGVNWSKGYPAAIPGWTWMEFNSNQYSPDNGKVVYVDYDDMVIYNSTPPNRDAGGNPWIGTLSAPPPTCSDGIKNGDETGVDCGGTCPPCEEDQTPLPPQRLSVEIYN